jgi:hypothetical protein
MLSVRYGECRFSECHFAGCRYSECHYAECCYSECHFAECRGAVKVPNVTLKTCFHRDRTRASTLCFF